MDRFGWFTPEGVSGPMNRTTSWDDRVRSKVELIRSRRPERSAGTVGYFVAMPASSRGSALMSNSGSVRLVQRNLRLPSRSEPPDSMHQKNSRTDIGLPRNKHPDMFVQRYRNRDSGQQPRRQPRGGSPVRCPYRSVVDLSEGDAATRTAHCPPDVHDERRAATNGPRAGREVEARKVCFDGGVLTDLGGHRRAVFVCSSRWRRRIVSSVMLTSQRPAPPALRLAFWTLAPPSIDRISPVM